MRWCRQRQSPCWSTPRCRVRRPNCPAADTLSSEIVVLKASTEHDLDTTFARLAALPAKALLVAADPFFNTRREKLIELAARYAVPAIYEFRDYPAAGGLVSYGISLADAYHQVGVYTGRILRGEMPTDLPVVQPTKFELVNLKTAKTLGLTFRKRCSPPPTR
jgi:putative ABC transport system substrate-binding protein